MTKPKTPPRKSLVPTIADKIRAAIVDAELDFGENLSEDTLASAFEVSRTPVREALNLLQMEGLVIIVPKSGTYVFTPTLEDIAELCDYRVGLEKQAIALTPQQSLPLAVSELQKQLQAMTEAIDSGDMQAYGRADTAFHLAFFHHCGNRYLKNAYDLILGRVASLRTHLAIRAEGEPDRSYKDHAHMISLFAENKRDQLSTILAAHILRTKDNYLDAFQKLSANVAGGRAARLRRRLALTE
ncbi:MULTISPECIES: GntR family transcriptional regulator [Brucella]|uniref:Transcriptional regulator, GntR family n=1 Tax=Ochrobactrum soli TaxID=2448455 RepID=A0A2P9HCE6_9HYPH|nr:MULTISPECIES: GntR family transcriptional regulator [Brucella]MDX4074437.1 GntR family transcriptional regulator [Brucella sp. NBRC 113783]SPL61769.1 Transcriptional regulator, GntR family [[Ochrobactrum] soli]